MKDKHLTFGKNHAKWTLQQWQQALFTDEPTVQQFTTRGRYVRRPTGRWFDERYTIPTMEFHPSVMISGAMSANETVGLFFLPPGMTINGHRHVDLLQDKLDHTWPSIIAQFLCKMVLHVIVPKSLHSS